ncbi:hypothetical protein [Streptomyces termitum]|uniref:hypothetical protein n=1 Tax=Streptomyces termitum TaxID=67368 RepID=UPI0033A7B9A2
MASIDYPYPDPTGDDERAANRQAADDYQHQEEEGATLLRLAGELGPVDPEVLLERLRLDLAGAGLHVTAFQPSDEENQGGVVVHLDDDGQVAVDWLLRARSAGTASATAGTGNEAVVRGEIVHHSMNTALGAILTGFGYTIRRPRFGLGHIVLPTLR